MYNLCRAPLLLMLLTMFLPSYSSEHHTWEEYFYALSALDENETPMDEDDYEALCDMESHPLNINTASWDELQQLPFLTTRQIDDIKEYISRHGPMLSLGELLLIKSIDYARRQLLTCFTYAGEPPAKKRPSLKAIIGKGRNELTFSLSQPLYKRKGDDNGYLGYQQKHSLRYTFDAGDDLRLGLLGSQDSGEPFFAEGNNAGYDHYSFYVQTRKRGAVDNLIVGHYRVQFGMGLVANSSFSLGKAASLATLGRTANAIRPSLSRSTANYMQGVATTLSLSKSLRLSVFASYRPIDATMGNDNSTIKTILSTGYHRTPSEMSKKNNCHSAVGGLNIKYTKNGLHVGLSAVYTHFDHDLRPDTSALYKRYYPAGNDFVNIGVDYGYTHHRFSISGETATDRHGAMATINTATASIGNGLNVMVLHRYYSTKYTSLHANSISEGGHVRNEHGLLMGIDWQATKALKIYAYADYSHAAWPRYRISAPSDAFDALLSSALTLSHWTVKGRYRLRLRYRDNADKSALLRHDSHTARLSATYDSGNGWTTTTQADMSLTGHDSFDKGYMLSQSLNAHWRWLRASLSAYYFDSDSYDSRLYAYERGPLYTFSFPSFYGQGLRYALFVRADIGKHLMASAKAGVTNYFDRAVIGSGLQQIDKSSKTDIDIQIRWRF